MLNEHERHVLDRFVAIGRGMDGATDGEFVGPLARRAGGWLAAGGYLIWLAVKRPNELLARPFRGRGRTVQVAGWTCVAALWVATLFTIFERPGSRMVEVGVRELARVTAQSLNVREAPGVDQAVQGQVYQDERLQVVDTVTDWLKVRLSDVGDGWISAGYVEREREAILEEQTDPRRGWIYLVLAFAVYLGLFGVARMLPREADSPAGARSATPGATRARRPDPTAKPPGAPKGDHPAGPEPVRPVNDRAELLAHLRAARGVLMEGVPRRRHEDFQRLWVTFQRRVLSGLDGGDAG